MPPQAPQPQPQPESGPSPLKAAIQEAKTELQSTPTATVKRGRGRPKKTDSAVNGQTGAPVPLPAPEPVIQNSAATLKPQLVMGFNFVFDSWAKNTEIEALKLSDDEAETMALPTAECLAAWFPQVSGKQLVTAAALFAIGSVSFSKYRIYTSEMEKKKADFEARALAAKNQAH